MIKILDLEEALEQIDDEALISIFFEQLGMEEKQELMRIVKRQLGG